MRTRLLISVPAVLLLALGTARSEPQAKPSPAPEVLVRDYSPRTHLVVKRTPVERAKFPVVDVHFHMDFDAEPGKVARTMDDLNIQMVMNLGSGNMSSDPLKRYVEKWVKAHPSRFAVMANLNAKTLNEPDFGEKATAQLREDVKNGAVALKIFKALGLVWRDANGRLIRPDDPRFDAVWRACAELKIPVLIHVNDVRAFFDPVDRFNERYVSLAVEGRSSWHGKVDVTHEELMTQFENVIARNPATTFIAAHMGMHYEHLHTGARWLDQYPNLFYDIGASCKHLGRQPYTARKFLIKYQDRILFGCDIGSVPRKEVYQYMFRLLETDDEYIDHVEPEAGIHWKMYGLYLPDDVLEKIYNGNARKLFPALLRSR